MRVLTPRRTVGATSQPVTLDEVKEHLKIEDTNADDAYVSALIDAAVSHLETFYGLALISQTWVQEFSDFADRLWLRRPRPVQSITSVQYYDTDNALQTVTASDYSLHQDAGGWFIWFDDNSFAEPGVYDRPDAVKVTFVAGYGDSWNDAPKAIRQSILLMISLWYRSRADVVIGQSIDELPRGVEALMGNYRAMRL